MKSRLREKTSNKVLVKPVMDGEDKHVIFKMIDTMLTKKKFKAFFPKRRCCIISKEPRISEVLYFKLLIVCAIQLTQR